MLRIEQARWAHWVSDPQYEGVEFALSDASPLLGTDWLLSETFRCLNPSRVYQIVRELQYYRQDAIDHVRGNVSPDLDDE
eukprot:5092497-Pyramimonas_sp.AAC.1